MNKNIVLSICAMIAMIVITGCGYIIEELGIYFNNIAYTRFIFGLGIVAGFMILWSGQVLGYFSVKLIRWKSKRNLYKELNILEKILSDSADFEGCPSPETFPKWQLRTFRYRQEEIKRLLGQKP